MTGRPCSTCGRLDCPHLIRILDERPAAMMTATALTLVAVNDAKLDVNSLNRAEVLNRLHDTALELGDDALASAAEELLADGADVPTIEATLRAIAITLRTKA